MDYQFAVLHMIFLVVYVMFMINKATFIDCIANDVDKRYLFGENSYSKQKTYSCGYLIIVHDKTKPY